MPSWLWQRRATAQTTRSERDAREVFDRAVGAATYAGWKKGVLKDEAEASAFYDEARYLLLNRMIAFEPQSLATLGGDWAYGVSVPTPVFSPTPSAPTTSLTNAALDAVLRAPHTHAPLRTFLRDNKARLGLSFTTTQAEWGHANSSAPAPRVMLDLLRFRREMDGSLDIAGVQQATHLGLLLVEFHEDKLIRDESSREVALGFANLSALLMALGLAYDSAAGRGTAAALAAIVTAKALVISAQLAGLLGPCPAFVVGRESKLRALRNQHRAAYGERTDYERLSILPATLDIASGADLVLIAAARRGWDEALAHVQKHGLRHLNLTALFESAVFAPLLECSAQGLAMETNLLRVQAVGPDAFRREVHPAVPMALRKIGCDPADVAAIVDHVVGHMTLVAAPGINHACLRKRGFDEAALARVENYLPHAKNLRTALTPWVVGERFCRERLQVEDGDLFDAGFDLLKHLGFTENDISAADAFCYGHGSVTGASRLPAGAEKIFVSGDTVQQAAAMTRMAAALQSFVSAPLQLKLSIPARTSVDERTALLLAAWRQGLSGITLEFDSSSVAPRTRKKLLARQAPLAPAIPATRTLRTSPLMTSPRATKPKTRSLGLKAKGTSRAHVDGIEKRI